MELFVLRTSSMKFSLLAPISSKYLIFSKNYGFDEIFDIFPKIYILYFSGMSLILCGLSSWTHQQEDGARKQTISLKAVILVIVKIKSMLFFVTWFRSSCWKYTYFEKRIWKVVRCVYFFKKCNARITKKFTKVLRYILVYVLS